MSTTVSTAALLRQLPEPPANARPGWAQRRDEAVASVRGTDLVHAAFTWRIVPLESVRGEMLLAGGEQLHAARLLPASGTLTALGVVVCTLGAGIEHAVSELFAARRPAAALALDELGNELLFALSRRAQDRLHAQALRQGLTVAGELRAGDPGLGLDAQQAVLRLAGGDSIGLACAPGGSLVPAKSSTAVVGVGIDLPEANWSRCDECPSAPRCALLARRRALET